MKKSHGASLILLVGAMLILGLKTSGKKPEHVVASTNSLHSQALARIADQYWQHLLEEDVFERMRFGLPIHDLPEISESKTKSNVAFAQHLLAELRKIDTPSLTHDETITRELVAWQCGSTIDRARFYWLQSSITPYASSISIVHQVFTTYRFTKPSDLSSYTDLLEKYPSYAHSIQHHLQGQFERGIIVPLPELTVVKPFLSSFIRAPQKSLFYVDSSRLQGVDGAAATSFQEHLIKIIRERINPSLQALVDYVNGEYSKKAPETVGLSQYPGGNEFYRYLVKQTTTLDLTPEEIHQIGLDAVAQLEAQMAQLRQAWGFKRGTQEFHHFLKNNPQFLAKTPEEVQDRLMAYVNRVRPRVNEFFRKIPKAPYGVKRLDPALEGGQTFGYYQQPTSGVPVGYYYFNGSSLNERPMVSAGAIILHELIPGHHFQINLEAENESLPMFRRELYYPAYGEGWGQYSAFLGIEMGAYPGPYDLYGELALDMFVSTRLVVDTGINYLGWTRARAIEYMREHLLESDTQIASETLRYSADIPAQALAYKIGVQKMLRLREKSQKALGDKFDIREFHGWILGEGSMPLSILDQHVDWSIAQAGGDSSKFHPQ